jgi:hypothetical protein
MQWNKPDIRKDSKGNEHLARMVEADRLLFHGIVPGSANHPLGKIKLGVCFDDSGNFRRLEFEVMDWPSQYYAILGRPAFAKFMAVPHYAYQALKFQDPRGSLQYKEALKYPIPTTRNSIGWRKHSA